MIILGIDPGLERLGYGLILREGSRLTSIDHGLIQTPRISVPDRLRSIDEQFRQLIDTHHPDAVATERQLFAANKTTALDVAKALGVVLLACSQRGLPWAEYTPPQVKLAVVGHGGADKRQVQFMVTKLLSLGTPPKPDDVADALAVAICHAFQSRIPEIAERRP
ncbi:MAG TPA: crossover junction endodeoxyribonuclease RuvC [Fimbriimonadaceae bacterium]|nr:crossover junction endodeoxyribonuclease RuvC [Fimbriimonadaceae bacterium]